MRSVLGMQTAHADDRRKIFGQYFTPDAVSLLACAAAGVSRDSRVIDPMCGDGSMLRAARAIALSTGGDASITGVELDDQLAIAAPGRTVAIYRGDVFALSAGIGASAASITPGAYDAVVGNPPYVRYQTLRDLYDVSGHAVASSVERAWGRRVGGSDIVRTLLLTLADAIRQLPQAERIAFAVAALKGKATVAPSGELEAAWIHAVVHYSGLADLSVPSWLLAWKLVRPGGRVALVSPKAWERRQYGGALRQFFALAADPVLVVEPIEPTWFKSAQVTAHLVAIERRGTPNREPQRDIPIAVTSTELDLADDLTLARALGRQRKPGSQPDARAARTWVDRITSGGGAIPGVVVGTRSWPDMRDGAAGRISKGHSSLGRFAQLWQSLPDGLICLGYEAHQGLRTGCNEFFYVEEVPLPKHAVGEGLVCVQLSPTFGRRHMHFPRALLRPAIRRQALLADAYDVTQLSHDLALVITDGTELDPEISRYIEEAASTSLVRGRKTVRIPEMSAVRTSAPGPGRRRWYQLPLAPRHEGAVLAPRVNGLHFRAFLNTRCQLVDANFSTFVSSSRPALSPRALAALLNADVVRAAMEAIGTPMGGGALKVEAAHLDELRIPSLGASDLNALEAIGRDLPKSQTSALAEANAVLVDAAARELGSSQVNLLTLVREALSEGKRARGAAG